MNHEQHKQLVWEKGRIVLGRSPNIWRHDDFGNLISYPDYGDRSSPFGWEIDHRNPSALGGSENLANLRPLHWRANARVGAVLAHALASVEPSKSGLKGLTPTLGRRPQSASPLGSLAKAMAPVQRGTAPLGGLAKAVAPVAQTAAPLSRLAEALAPVQRATAPLGGLAKAVAPVAQTAAPLSRLAEALAPVQRATAPFSPLAEELARARREPK